MDVNECHICDGDKGSYYSCCGDELGADPDSDFCPTCNEHCGEGDFEPCEYCNGLGKIHETESDVEFVNAAQLMKKIVDKHNQWKQTLRDGGMAMDIKPPRGVSQGHQYFNIEDGLIWTLSGSSWTPEPKPANHITRIPCTYKLDGPHVEEMINADNVHDMFPDGDGTRDVNPCSEIALDCQMSPMRLITPYTEEQKKAIETAQQLAWLEETDRHKKPQEDNEQTNSNRNKPLQDYSIFKPHR